MAPVRVLRAMLAVLLGGCALHAPDPHAELKVAINAARAASILGPAEVILAGRTMLELDPGFAYIPPEEGARLLRALNRPARKNLLGVVVAGPPEGAEVAALYLDGRAGVRDPALPEIALDGWKNTPALAGFRVRK